MKASDKPEEMLKAAFTWWWIQKWNVFSVCSWTLTYTLDSHSADCVVWRGSSLEANNHQNDWKFGSFPCLTCGQRAPWTSRELSNSRAGRAEDFSGKRLVTLLTAFLGKLIAADKKECCMFTSLFFHSSHLHGGCNFIIRCAQRLIRIYLSGWYLKSGSWFIMFFQFISQEVKNC